MHPSGIRLSGFGFRSVDPCCHGSYDFVGTPALADGNPVNDAFQIIVLSFVIVVVCGLGFFAISRLRRSLKAPDDTIGIGFTLSDLRQLHKSGQMSDVEFERAKEKLVAHARKPVEQPKKS
jgi:hypothetical protein